MACVRVAVRVRPLNKRERDLSSKVIIHMDGNKTSVFSVKDILMNTSEEKTKSFTYDFSYDSSNAKKPNFATQDKVFTDLGHDVLEAAFEGYNACIFAYGQTGSGKSYTMMGTADDVGLIPRICEGLFSQIAELSQTEHTSFHTSVSYLEIYNERVRDLLGRKPSEGSCLRVREHPRDGPYVEGLSMQQVQSFIDMERLMEKGNASRATARTAMNETSSRSHAIFTINFRQARFDAELPSETTSKIHLVDLAGSERAEATRATGARLKEGANINKSLVALGNVISALADASVSGGLRTKKKGAFIPYRDSVLTWLLKDSLGGNSKTIMIATISPAHLNYNETLSTLRYANRVKNIVNQPMVNEDGNVKIIRELREEIAHLKALLSQGTRVSPVGPRLEASVEEKLHRNEARVQQLTQEWTNKWKETQSILREETVALRKEGSGVVLDSELPHLIGIDDDLLSTGVILYRLEEGRTSVGRADAATKQDIVLDSVGVMKEHCVFENRDGAVILRPLPGAACSVSGAEVTGPCQLTQGAVVVLGTGTTFRFNHPKEAAALRLKRQSGLLSIKDLSGSSEMLSKAMLHNSRGDLRVLKSGENVESKCSREDRATEMWTSEEAEGLVPQEQRKEDELEHSLPIMPQEGGPQHVQLETTAGQLTSGQRRGQPGLAGGASGAGLNEDMPEDISVRLREEHRTLESGKVVESDHSHEAPGAQTWTLEEVEGHVREEQRKEEDGEEEKDHGLPIMPLEEGSQAQQEDDSTARQLRQHGGQRDWTEISGASLNGHNVLEDISIQLRGDPRALGGGEIMEPEQQNEGLTIQTWTSEQLEGHEEETLPIMPLEEGSPEEWQDEMTAGQDTKGRHKGQPAWSEGSSAAPSGDAQSEEISSQPSCVPNGLPEEEVAVEAHGSSPGSPAQACELVLSHASDGPSSFPLPWAREDELQGGGGGGGGEGSTSEPQAALSPHTPVGSLGPAADHTPWEEVSQASSSAFSSSSPSSPSSPSSSSTCSSPEQQKQQDSTPHPSVPRAQVSEAVSAEASELVPGGEWQRQPVGLQPQADGSGPGTAGPEGAPNKHSGPLSDVRRVPLSLSGSSGGTSLVVEPPGSLAEDAESRGGGESCSLLPANTLPPPPPPPPPSVFAEALTGQRREPAEKLAVEVQFNRGVISALSVETSQIQAEQKAAQSQADDSSASPKPVPNSNSSSDAPPPPGNGMVSWMSGMLKDAGRHLPSPATQLLQQAPSLGGLYTQVCSLVKEVPFLQQLRLELTLSPGATAVDARDLGLLQAPARIKELLSPQKMTTDSLPRELGAFKDLLPTLPEQRPMGLYDDQDQQRGGKAIDRSLPWHSGETLSSKPPSPSGLAQIDSSVQQDSAPGASADADTAQMLRCATSPSSEAAVQVWTQRLVDYPPHMLKLQSLPVASLLPCLLAVLPDEALLSQCPLVACWLSAASCARPEPRPALALLLESALYTLALGPESSPAPATSILQPLQRMSVLHHLPLVQVTEIHVGFAGQSVRLAGSTASSVVTLYTHCPTLTQDLCRRLLSALGARGKPAVDDDSGTHPLLAGDLRRQALDWAAPTVPDLLLCAGLRVSSRFQKSLAQLVCLLHGNMEGRRRPALAQVRVLLYAAVRRSFETGTETDSSAFGASKSEPAEEEREGGGGTQVVLQFFLTDTHLGLLQEDAVFYPPPRSLALVPNCPQFSLRQMRPREDVRCVVVKDATRLEVVLVPQTSSTMTSTPAGDGGHRGQSRLDGNGIAIRADHHRQRSHLPSPRPEVWKLTFASANEASSLINYLSNV